MPRQLRFLIISSICLTLLLAACRTASDSQMAEGGPGPTSTSTQTATSTSTVTPLSASSTPSPAPTVTLTETPEPTATPEPTSTLEPTATPEPESYFDSISVSIDVTGLNDRRFDKVVTEAAFVEQSERPFRNPETGEETFSGEDAFWRATAIVLGHLYGINDPHLLPFEQLKARINEYAKDVPEEELITEIEINYFVYEGDRPEVLARIEQLYGELDFSAEEIGGSRSLVDGELMNAHVHVIEVNDNGRRLRIFGGVNFGPDLLDREVTFLTLGSFGFSASYGDIVDQNYNSATLDLTYVRELHNPEGTSWRIIGAPIVFDVAEK